jgi:hypothetical protein
MPSRGPRGGSTTCCEPPQSVRDPRGVPEHQQRGRRGGAADVSVGGNPRSSLSGRDARRTGHVAMQSPAGEQGSPRTRVDGSGFYARGRRRIVAESLVDRQRHHRNRLDRSRRSQPRPRQLALQPLLSCTQKFVFVMRGGSTSQASSRVAAVPRKRPKALMERLLIGLPSARAGLFRLLSGATRPLSGSGSSLGQRSPSRRPAPLAGQQRRLLL